MHYNVLIVLIGRARHSVRAAWLQLTPGAHGVTRPTTLSLSVPICAHL